MSKHPRRSNISVQRFGGRHTAKKQSVVVDYLRAYAILMSKQDFHISYVDAFAGCGQRIDAWDREQRVGHNDAQADLGFEHPSPPTRTSTAMEALRLDPGFHRYVFGDLKASYVRALEAMIAKAHAAREDLPEAIVRQADANVLVRDECAWLAANQMRRAVVFLDPYGMQVRWTTLEAIASTGKVDLWLLLPTGIAVNRLLPRRSAQHLLWARKMNEFYGSNDWRSAFTTTETDLLGEERRVTSTSVERILSYTMDRLRGLFGEGLYPDSLELRTRGTVAYHLVFACASKSRSAINLAHRIAGHLLNKSQAGS